MTHIPEVRKIVETLVSNITDPNYQQSMCENLVQVFDAEICAVLWFRQRQPAGWWIDAWSSRIPEVHPERDNLPEGEDAVLDSCLENRAIRWIDDIENRSLVKAFQPISPKDAKLLLVPLTPNSDRFGVLAFFLSASSQLVVAEQSELELYHDLVNTGVRNHLLYKELQESEEEFKDLIENSSDMVVVIYPDGIIRECNREFVDNLQLKVDPRGMSITDLLTEDKGEAFADSWIRLLQHQPVNNVDIKFRREDGSTIEAELSGNVRLKPDGKIAVIRLYLRDLTERHETERRHRELELEVELHRQRQLAQIGLYASGITHNLLNPVQILFSYIEAIQMRSGEFPEIDVISRSTERIMGIINNLLTKMRHEQNQDISLVDINELLETELTFLEANFFFKHEVTKSLKLSESLPILEGLYSDFSQAVMNVVYNALDAMKNSVTKELEITTDYDGERNAVIITISDTGTGIPLELQDKVFDPFFTTKNAEEKSKTDVAGGSGLGLSSSQALLGNYGGTIGFESESGKGTVFSISIPAKSD